MNANRYPVIRNTLRLIGVITLGLGLVACGSESGGDGSQSDDVDADVGAGSESGDGSDSDDEDTDVGAVPATPGLSLTAESIKTFAFSWPEVIGVTGYRLLENPDDASGYTEIASIDATATGYDLEVFLPGLINASYILEACNNNGCVDSEAVFVNTSLAEAVGYVKASNTNDDDDFGFSVALSADGHTMAVGARNEQSAATGIDGDETDNFANASGAVYIFVRNGSGWNQQAYLKASNAEAIDYFGSSMALAGNGDTLVVSAPLEDSDAVGIDGDQQKNDASDSGAVYVFSRTGTAWSQQAYLKASNAREDHEFGSSVALSDSGDSLAVGARYEDSASKGVNEDQLDDSSFKSGAVYVFSRNEAAWSQQAYLKPSNTDPGNAFGTSLDLAADGETLVVGADNEDSNATGINGDQNDKSAGQSGAAYVFVRNGSNWHQQAYIKASNTEAFDYFGFSVALAADGNTLAVGAVQEDSRATGIDGDQDDEFSGSNNYGAVYVFSRTGSAWTQQAYVKASSSSGDGIRFGFSIDLSASGDVMAVGARNEDSSALGIDGDQLDTTASNSGAAYVFTRDGTVWKQQAYVKALNTAVGAWFGTAIALSSDGELLAVGARRDRSGATGIGGDPFDLTDNERYGAVFLY